MNRVAYLDGIRAIAILAVVGFHSTPALRGGFLGVDVFFTLSGFLITSLLLSEYRRDGAIDLSRFYLRRALRLLPALVTLVLGCVLYETLYRRFDGGQSIWLRSLFALSFVSNWIWAYTAPADWLGSLNAIWSLAIEWQFYLVWPALLLGLLRRGVRKEVIAAGLAAAIIGSLGWRLFLLGTGATMWRVYAGADTHSDGILLGCLAAILMHGAESVPPPSARRSLYAPAALALLAVLFWRAPLTSRLTIAAGYSMTAVLTSVLIWEMSSGAAVWVRIIGSFPMQWLGKLSYSLYLWHSAANLYLEHHFPHCVPLLRIAAGLCLAILSYYLVESPFLKLKGRWGRRRPVPVVPIDERTPPLR